MAEKNIQMNVKNTTGNYDILHPMSDANITAYSSSILLTENVQDTVETVANNMADIAINATQILNRSNGMFIIARNISIASSAWASNSTYADYKYRATINVTGCTSDHVPDVYFNLADATSGNFAPVAQTNGSSVYIYAATKPTSTITIECIKLTEDASKIAPVSFLTGIAVSHLPTKVEYNEGERLNLSGLQVTALYSDDTSRTVTNYSTSILDNTVLTLDDDTVTVSYTESGITKTDFFKITVSSTIPVIKNFSNYSNAEFKAIAQALQAGTITPSQLNWEVGDTRDVALSSFTTYPNGIATTQPSQTAQLVILAKGGKQFTDNNDCSYIIGFKNCVAKTCYNTNGTNAYSNSTLRTVEDNIYNALPDDIKASFKQFKAVTGIYDGKSYGTYVASMCSPAAREIFGGGRETEGPDTQYSILDEFINLGSAAQFEYYTTPNNRTKKEVGTDNLTTYYLRSPDCTSGSMARFVLSDGTSLGHYEVDTTFGIAPYGCI